MAKKEKKIPAEETVETTEAVEETVEAPSVDPW